MAEEMAIQREKMSARPTTQALSKKPTRVEEIKEERNLRDERKEISKKKEVEEKIQKVIDVYA